MFFKKTITGIAALAVVVSASGLSAFAEETTASAGKNGYKEAKLEALLHSFDNVQEIDCRYYDSLPSIPYIKLSDYYKLWTDQEIRITKNDDGTYALETPFGVTGYIDTDKDIIHSDFYDYLFASVQTAQAEDPLEDLYIKWRSVTSENAQEDQPASETEVDPDAYAYEVDLGAYNLDLIAGDDEVWFPAPTICDLFLTDSSIAFYMDDKLIFGNAQWSGFSVTELPYTEEHANNLIQKYLENGRPQDLADYNYNELCFLFDRNYAYPGRPYYTQLLWEKGLDGMLSEANDSTRKIKELLHSTDYAEYLAAYNYLNYYLWDGGHTRFDTAITDFEELANIIDNKQKELDLELENSIDYKTDYKTSYVTAAYVQAARDEMIKTADYKEEVEGTELMSGYVYCEKGDTAFFSFEYFDSDFYAWDDYYHKNGEMSSDIVSYFSKCVERADKNPDITKFVIDLGTNGGGYNVVAYYMLGIMADVHEAYLYYPSMNVIFATPYDVDKNFDRVIDEKDDNFKTNLDYGIITSAYSFSMANNFPGMAHDAGIAIIGERSGGGACCATHRVTPDGNVAALSAYNCFVDSKGNSIDLGVEPDFGGVVENADGTKDFSAVYNFDNLSKFLDEYYGEDDTNTTTTTTSASTTTSAATTTTTSAASSETTSSAETSSTQTSATTSTEADTSTTTTTKPAVIGSNEEIGKMAAKDYLSKTGKELKVARTTENKDGTVSVELAGEDGKVVETYTVDPVTGKGKDSKGNDVDLPQTGNNSVKTVAAAAVAVTFMTVGAAAVYSSGIIRRKKDDE